ncbi:tyrosine-type recombinase/integrase [Siminovitchia fortis]|uniref:Site-specific integrase n=1 Tax=Siminovitchia fortis TaxID=254758 RepID=A0A443IM21_9BACI|nr:tyrosine-type recombinase/integrase [Siminovitchia fortis]RWR06704.1 site-specific integrase [Siminovitchia fortis]WHY82969.1 tyrosine-type recombinase/integrase [Siminovitchia fortis]
MASATPLGNDKYKIYVELGYNEKGKRIRRTKTVTAKSQRALKKAMTDFEIEVHKNKDAANIEKITFEQFVERWMDVYVKVNLMVKTRDAYNNYLKRGVMEGLGKFEMDKIRAYHIEMFFKKQKEDGAKSLQGKYMMLKSIFSKALKWEVIKNNPMINVDPPRVEKKSREIQFYDEKQLKHLLKVLDDVYPKHRIMIKLAVLVGLRRTEIAGIRMENINYNDNSILIDKTLQYDKETKKFFLGPTKPKRSRIVHVPATFMKELKEYAKQQKKLQLSCGSAWNPMLDDEGKPVNLLFTKKDGFPAHPDSLTGRWRDIVKRHNLPPLNLHGLRHTYASFAISRGVNFKVIQEQLGHADIKQTLNTYSHLTKKDKQKASDVFNAIL